MRPDLPSGQRGRAGQRGQTSAEYLGILLLVAVLIGAVLASGAAGTITRRTGEIVCEIAGGTDCGKSAEEKAADGAPDPECIVRSSSRKAGANVFVAVVKVGTESALIREDHADGSVTFTLVNNAEVAAELFAGVEGHVGKYGLDYSAQASAGGQLEGAKTYEFSPKDRDKADEFQANASKAGTFGQLVRDTGEGFDPGGIKDWVGDKIFGEDFDPSKLGEPTSSYIEGKLKINGDATGAIGAGVVSSEVKAAAEASGGARVIASGPEAGNIELNYLVKGEAGGSLTAGALGPNIKGSGEAVVTVTLSKKDGFRPSKLNVQAAAEYNGAPLDLNRTLKGDSLKSISKALEEASVTSTDGEGHAVEFSGEVALDDPADQATALALVTPGPGQVAAAPEAVRLLDAKGKLVTQTYDTTAKEQGAGGKAGFGPGFGGEGKQEESTKDLSGAQVREPGEDWKPRNCGKI